LIAVAHRAVQKQGFGFAERPDHRLDRVPAQLFQGGYALIAIDNQIVLGLLGGNHDDRRLLATACQRGQQATMLLRPMHPKVFQTPLKLVKFQPHHPRPLRCYHPNMDPALSGIARQVGGVSSDLPWNQRHSGATGIARS
jgi:hypothetical protein